MVCVPSSPPRSMRSASWPSSSSGGSELKQLAEAALESAKAGEIDAVVVGGGDGSIRTVAGVLAGSEVPLGILPLGTLNHFAKDLGIPLHLGEAAEVIAKGAQRDVDLAEVNGETFINNSWIGIYPYMVLDRERRRAHHKVAKWMAMVPALFRARRGTFRAAGSLFEPGVRRGPVVRRSLSSATTVAGFIAASAAAPFRSRHALGLWSSNGVRGGCSGWCCAWPSARSTKRATSKASG